MSNKPEFMTHERIMTGEEYVSYSDYLSLQRELDEALNKIKGWKNKWSCAVEIAAQALHDLDNMKEKLNDILQKPDKQQ